MKKKTTQRAQELNVDEVVVRQSLAERRAAEAHLRVLIDLHALTHVRLINATRRNLRKRLPTANELIYEYRDCIVISFAPNAHGYEGVFSIRAGETGVRLYFNRGKGLDDPEKRLRGSGKLVRFIGLEGSATLSLPSVSGMIDEAILRSLSPSLPKDEAQSLCNR